MRASTFIISKIKNPHLHSESLSELENSEIEVSLKLYLKKPRFIEETSYSGNLHHLPTNVKSISSYCRQFQLTIFLHQAIIVAYIFRKPHLYRAATVSVCPKITLDQLEH